VGAAKEVRRDDVHRQIHLRKMKTGGENENEIEEGVKGGGEKIKIERRRDYL
jgi:hypothetical protein